MADFSPRFPRLLARGPISLPRALLRAALLYGVIVPGIQLLFAAVGLAGKGAGASTSVLEPKLLLLLGSLGVTDVGLRWSADRIPGRRAAALLEDGALALWLSTSIRLEHLVTRPLGVWLLTLAVMTGLFTALLFGQRWLMKPHGTPERPETLGGDLT